VTSYINVVDDYGADRTGVTDSTAAIQNAINAAPFRAVLALPYGNYVISAPLIIDRSQIALVGWGEEFTTQISIASSADPACALIVGNTQSVLNVKIQGLTFKGRNDTTTTGQGIHWRAGVSTMEQCRVLQFGGHGVVVEGFGAGINDVVFDNCYFSQNGNNAANPGDNLRILNTVYDCEYNVVKCAGNVAKNTSRYGIYNQGFSQKFTQCHTYFNSSHGMFLDTPAEGTQIIGGEYENNSGDGIHLNAVGFFSFIGLQTYGQSASKDISIINSSYGSITGCMLESTTTDKNIFLTSSNRITIGNNVIKGANSASIDISTGSTRNIVTGNYCETGKISITGTDNIIKDNMLGGVSIVEQTGADNNAIEGNKLFGGGTVTKVGANTRVRQNTGFATEAHGSASITSGNTSVVVAHGIALTPTLEQISVTPQTSLGSAVNFWISNPTSTTFTINLNANPGATVTFGWRSDVGY